MPNTGTSGIAGLVIGIKHTATHFGSGTIDVFATPAMIALMEQTAMQSVQSQLPEGYITLGTEVNVKHYKAVLQGQTVNCKTLLLETDGKKLVFRVEVFCDNECIGDGFHTRVIADKHKFLNKLQSTPNS